MQTRIVAVHPGLPTVVDAMVAGVQVQAEWVGAPPEAGAIDDGQLALREGPVLRGILEMQEQELLTIRIAEGLVRVESNDSSVDVPPGSAIALSGSHLKLYPTGV